MNICVYLIFGLLPFALINAIQTSLPKTDLSESSKKEKRGILNYLFPNVGNPPHPPPLDYHQHWAPSGPAFPHIGTHYHTTITKKFGVPYPVKVPVPYPVHVDRPVPYAVPKPYPLPVPVAVERPVPYPVHKPYPVPVAPHHHIPVPHGASLGDPWGARW